MPIPTQSQQVTLGDKRQATSPAHALLALPKRCALLGSVFVLVAFAQSAAASPIVQSFIPLGKLNGTTSLRISGVNNLGQVVGWNSNGATTQAVLWNNESPIALQGLGGTNTLAYGINNSGRIVGSSDVANNLDYRAVLWNGNSAPAIIGPSFGTARAINSAGDIGGSVRLGEWASQPTIFRSDGTTLGLQTPLPGDYVVTGMNDSTKAVGFVLTVPGPSGNTALPVLWDGSSATFLSNPSGSAIARAINNAGDIVGDGNSKALLWSGPDVTTLLGPQGSIATRASDINNNGLIVGASGVQSFERRAVVWLNLEAFDLTALLASSGLGANWILNNAFAVSDNGWIAGDAMNSVTGIQAGFLLSVSVVPEPSSLAILLIGLLIVFSAVRLRSR